MLDDTGEQRDGKPPLSPTRIITELFLGGVGGFVGIFLAIVVAHLVGAVFGIDLEGEAPAVLGTIIDILALAVSGLGSAIGVYVVGNRGKETGSFLATAAAGAGVWIVGSIIIGPIIEALSDMERIGLILSPLFYPAASICATIAFNLTRKYDPPPAESETAPINTRDS